MKFSYLFFLLIFLFGGNRNAFSQNSDYYLLDSVDLSGLSASDSLHIEKHLALFHETDSLASKLDALQNLTLCYAYDLILRYMDVMEKLALEGLSKSKTKSDSSVFGYHYAASFYNRGFVQKELDAFSQALINYQKAEDIFKKYGHLEAVSVVYNSKGHIQSSIGLVEEAIENYNKSIDLALETNSEQRLCEAYLNFANLNSDLDEEELTFEYLDKALQLAEANDLKRYIALVKAEKAYNYERFNRKENVIEDYQDAISDYLELEDFRLASIALTNLSRHYFDLTNDLHGADSIVQLAIENAEKANIKRQKMEAIFRLGSFYYKSEAFQKSLPYFEKVLQYSEETQNERLAQNVREYLYQVYEQLGMSQKALKVLESFHKLEIETQNNDNKLALARQSEKHKYQSQKAEDDLKNAQEIALVESEAKRQRNFSISVVLISLLILIALLIIYSKLKQIRKQKAALDQAYIQLEKSKENEVLASNLKALQSQMNPHFIFNALNSIQALVLRGQVESSYEFINKFAALIRETLNFSEKEFVPLAEEFKLLQTYLALEKLRFKEEFEYHFNADGVNQNLKIPPMLIQPFIENALKHGLLHKENDRKLSLHFKQEEVLVCTVEDNGIGREASQKIKERRMKEHKSFAISAIEKRFRLLQEKHQVNIGFEYQDLMENGQTSGTKVTIRIPYKDLSQESEASAQTFKTQS